jgi:hypothetical protein
MEKDSAAKRPGRLVAAETANRECGIKPQSMDQHITYLSHSSCSKIFRTVKVLALTYDEGCC